MSDNFDIVIVGAGPVGLLLAVCLARWGYTIKQVDNREVPTITGRADGIQPRSLHLLRNMDLKRQIMAHKPAKVYEVAFWDPLPKGEGIHRTGNSMACPPFIGARYPFTTLLHQGLIERVFISDLRKNGVDVQRPWTVTSFSNVHGDHHPIEVCLQHVQKEEKEVVRTKYLFSGEGSRSFIRDKLGVKLHHKDPISNVWSVMDGVVRTDFPDIKMKCTIHSDHGSVMIIPRENNLVRFYIQIATSTDPDFNPRKRATAQELQASARKILQPYYLEWDHVEWYSVYPISQGIAEKYTIDQRIFLGGDCCHTHSPKAGQGMNTAFHDALNLAWKIHLVEAGFADRSVLETYETERKRIAEDLLDFDNKYAALFSRRKKSSGEVKTASNHEDEGDGFVQMFKSSQEFTSGYGVNYGPNVFNWSSNHHAKSRLFSTRGNTPRTGRVMPAVDVTRVVDANTVQLEQEIPLNGSFRIFIFAGDRSVTSRALNDLASNFQRKGSFYSTFARDDISNVSYHERDNPHSRFFSVCTIFAAQRAQIEIEKMLPPLFSRYRDHVYADDICDSAMPGVEAAAHAKMDLETTKGGVVIVRPDGHVGCIVDLEEGFETVDALNQYFGAFVARPLGRLVAHL